MPLIIYGAGSAVGFYALQLAKRSNIHPLLCVAGRSKDYVLSHLDPSKGDAVVDYREGDEAVISGLVAALKDKGFPPVKHALDAVSEGSSARNIGEVFRRVGAIDTPDGVKPKVTFVLGHKQEGVPDGVEQSVTTVGDVHSKEEGKDLGYVFFRYFAKGLHEGWFKGQKWEVVPGGLGGIEGALRKLKAGEASAVKYVFRIAETEGVGK